MKTRTPILLLAVLGAVRLAPAQGDKEGVIQCANLIYAGVQTSRCFSDEFLHIAQRETGIPTARRFKSVKLDSEELFEYPFVMMTGESSFHLSQAERDNLRRYLDKGGFLMASAGCSSKEWDDTFRREINGLFEDTRLADLAMDHALWKTVYDIGSIQLHRPGGEARMAGLERNGKLVVVYSPEGLNNTANVEGCCCCGGNEINNAAEIAVNILVYSLLY